MVVQHLPIYKEEVVTVPHRKMYGNGYIIVVLQFNMQCNPTNVDHYLLEI